MQNFKALTPIQKFYQNKTVFATGGTGFLGKVILEKLLYACDVKNVYLLTVPLEKGMNPQQQVQNLAKYKLFSRVLAEKPQILDKVIPIAGDLTAPSLGINDKDLEKLRKEVNVVFHAGASVQFNREINSIIKLNMMGTKKVIDFAKQMQNLESMIFFSTCYSGADQAVHEEKKYEWHQSPKEILQKCIEGKLDQNTIKPFVNTYAYSKRMAELMIHEEKGNLPITIVRPSIVTSTVAEPFPGWVDNYNHVVSFITSGANGTLRTGLFDRNAHIEYCPVDMVANGVISAAWHQGSTKDKSVVPVYNLTCTQDSRITFGKCIDLSTKYVKEYPFEKMYWYPNMKATTNETIHAIKKVLYQRIPAYILDLFVATEKNMNLKQMQERQDKSMKYVKYLLAYKYDFRTDKLLELYSKMSPEDQKLFNFITRDISGEKYIKDIVLGIRRYLLKQSDDTIPEARKKLFRLKVLDRTYKLAVLSGIAGGVYMLPIPWDTVMSGVF